MSQLKIFICMFFLSISILLYSINVIAEIDLEIGSIHRDSMSFSLEQKTLVWDLEDVAAESGIASVRSIVAYLSPNEHESYLILERKLMLAEINLNTEAVTGPWPLTQPCSEETEDCSHWWIGRWSGQEVIESAILKRYTKEFPYAGGVSEFWFAPESERKKSIGCLAMTPLRYGDVNGDGKNELVLYLTDTLVVFSLEKEKVIFASLIDFDDWMSREKTEELKELMAVNDVMPQFASKALANAANQTSHIGTGYRGYAKLYFGEFNGDGVQDIVVWRKLYESRLVNDDTSGFTKLGDLYAHYSFMEGEYQLQGTEESDIRKWLSNKQLTWQEGYPAKSECAGQENQLIPEMHDPLLNDPDVMK